LPYAPRLPPAPTLFPYTTLFRSAVTVGRNRLQLKLRPVPVIRCASGCSCRWRRLAAGQRRQHGARGHCGQQLQRLAPAHPACVGGRRAVDVRGRSALALWRFLHHSLLALSWSASQALVRVASVMMVRVQFLCGLDANTPPAITNRLGQSQVWPHWLVTESVLELPIRVVPTSWMISPPFLIASSGVGKSSTVAPMVSRMALAVFRPCSTCLSSCSDHFQWKRGTGI